MQIVAHTMEYTGGEIFCELDVANYTVDDYAEYKRVYEECFFDMRTALELQPVNCCDSNDILLGKATQIFILREDGIFVGSVAIYGNEIDDLVVSKESQNRGYGKKLLLFAVSKMQKSQVNSIMLHVADWNKNAINLYLNNEFIISKTETIN
ncbi:GNAT family N-acetyltransferase [Paludicola sp. MB14-C6]|uniref:GNAT family N-acetyltransferase n=1 Tax=Paludihabitans sp. MB14-C6 TaxID=3070656 RepID=UPI0027DCE4DE|nr:GNAT family N-acetyltransferase [Paludicola sp. MB14-C6]WMJ22668.1 GNAT family N-acetyltransferase [Paludicola sp. MB14-C6]